MCIAGPAGFEPATSWLTARHSAVELRAITHVHSCCVTTSGACNTLLPVTAEGCYMSQVATLVSCHMPSCILPHVSGGDCVRPRDSNPNFPVHRVCCQLHQDAGPQEIKPAHQVAFKVIATKDRSLTRDSNSDCVGFESTASASWASEGSAAGGEVTFH